MNPKKRSTIMSETQDLPEDIIKDIHFSCKCYDSTDLSCAACVLNFLRLRINSLKKSTGEKLGVYLNDLIYSNNTSYRYLPQFYDVILDLINSKFAPKVHNNYKSTNYKPELVCKILFSDKRILDIDLGRIFRDKSVMDTLPDFVPNVRPTIVYRYINPIRNKVFNNKQTMAELNVDKFIDNYENTDCQ